LVRVAPGLPQLPRGPDGRRRAGQGIPRGAGQKPGCLHPPRHPGSVIAQAAAEHLSGPRRPAPLNAARSKLTTETGSDALVSMKKPAPCDAFEANELWVCAAAKTRISASRAARANRLPWIEWRIAKRSRKNSTGIQASTLGQQSCPASRPHRRIRAE